MADYPEDSFIVAVYNPSLIPSTHLKLKVPHGHYDIHTYDIYQQDKKKKNSAVICYNKTVESGDYVNDCELHIQA